MKILILILMLIGSFSGQATCFGWTENAPNFLNWGTDPHSGSLSLIVHKTGGTCTDFMISIHRAPDSTYSRYLQDATSTHTLNFNFFKDSGYTNEIYDHYDASGTTNNFIFGSFGTGNDQTAIVYFQYTETPYPFHATYNNPASYTYEVYETTGTTIPGSGVTPWASAAIFQQMVVPKVAHVSFSTFTDYDTPTLDIAETLDFGTMTQNTAVTRLSTIYAFGNYPFKIKATSLNNGTLVNTSASGQTITYTTKVDGTTINMVGGEKEWVDENVSSSTYNSYAVEFEAEFSGAFQGAGSYSDTVTVTVELQ